MILPPPSPESLAHQAKLLLHLEQLCAKEKGWIPFAEFMQAALYAPGLGYYSAGMTKLGEAGDFVTAPLISPLFSQCLANQCLQILENIATPSLLELGAGNGVMAGEILHFLKAREKLPEYYFILEVSAELKERQKIYLKQHCPFFFDRIIWLDKLPDTPFNGILLANEVLDALSHHRFQLGENGTILEEYVGQEKGAWVSRFQETHNPLLKEEVSHVLNSLPFPLEKDYTSEINLQLLPWLKSLAACLNQGVMLFIDYGFPRHEFYHPSRSMGTLMCHYRHHAHPNPLLYIGLQDITVHVDFTQLAEKASLCGLSLAGFTHQGAFLINNGLMALAEESERDIFRRSQQIQKLTAPHEMGELFKVMALSKNYDEPLQGFALFDQSHRL